MACATALSTSISDLWHMSAFAKKPAAGAKITVRMNIWKGSHEWSAVTEWNYSKYLTDHNLFRRYCTLMLLCLFLYHSAESDRGADRV